MDNQEQKITDISIYIAGLQATYRPAPDARHTTIGSLPMKSIPLSNVWILRSILRRNNSSMQ